MIVWINGPFGVGKSTLARKLGGTVFEPEWIGSALIPVRRVLRPDDYQHWRLWRVLSRLAVGAVARVRPTVVVPMTILRPDYFDEIVRPLPDVRHVCLRASRETLLRRAPDRAAWVAKKYDEYEPSLRDERFGPFVDTDDLDAEAVAQRVRAILR